jgi:endonuclease/exonuclease/phosphatase family metal-dependent hydrolase
MLDMHGVYAAAFQRGGEEFGNALLTRWPIVEQHEHDVSLHGYRRRVVLEALVKADGLTLQLMSLHLGVSPRERALQAQKLFELCSATRADFHLLLGDFNEWSRFSAVSRRLHAYFDATRQLPTFPSRVPVVGLDRVWVHPRGRIRATHVEKSPPARLASDHLPLVATIESH